MENKSRKSYCLSAFLLQNHRIAESSELEGTLKGHPVQLPCNEQGHLMLHQLLGALSSLTLCVSIDGCM